jgi:hypothetical protein
MTCRGIQGLIDTLSFAQDRTSRLATIERHARGCAACRRALATASELDRGLAGLVEPAPPEGLSSAIRWRLAEDLEARARTRDPVTPADRREGAASGQGGGPLAWAALVAGAAIACCAVAFRWLGGEALLVLAPLVNRSGLAGLLEARLGDVSAPAVALGLALGLVLYAAGLFGMLPTGRRAHGGS